MVQTLNDCYQNRLRFKYRANVMSLTLHISTQKKRNNEYLRVFPLYKVFALSVFIEYTRP